eukprot:6181295-Pleurochrysis_carterae.AAC.1
MAESSGSTNECGTIGAKSDQRRWRSGSIASLAPLPPCSGCRCPRWAPLANCLSYHDTAPCVTSECSAICDEE